MSRKENLLREACALAAQEETERLKKRMGVQNAREAEALYKRNRRAVLALIARRTRRSRAAVYLRVAACLIAVAGGVWLAFFRQSPDYTPLTPGPSASVRPFDSSVPAAATATSVVTALPTEVESVVSEAPTFPTEWPYIEETEMSFPTESPTAAITPTFFPTPTPTPVPTPEPTEMNAEEMNGVQFGGIFPPAAWQGTHFPQWLPEGGDMEITLSESAAGSYTARITISGNGHAPAQVFEFTEYTASRPLPLSAEEAKGAKYIPLGQGAALRVVSSLGAVRLLWDQDGRSMVLSSVTAAEAEMEKIAASVEKILQE